MKQLNEVCPSIVTKEHFERFEKKAKELMNAEIVKKKPRFTLCGFFSSKLFPF